MCCLIPWAIISMAFAVAFRLIGTSIVVRFVRFVRFFDSVHGSHYDPHRFQSMTLTARITPWAKFNASAIVPFLFIVNSRTQIWFQYVLHHQSESGLTGNTVTSAPGRKFDHQNPKPDKTFRPAKETRDETFNLWYRGFCVEVQLYKHLVSTYIAPIER